MNETTKYYTLQKKILINLVFSGGLLVSVIVNSSFMKFFTDVIGISPALYGVAFLIFSIWKGINDPIIGYWADKQPYRTGKGKYLPLIRCAIPIIGVPVITLLFTSPGWNDIVTMMGVRLGDIAAVELVAPELQIGRRMDGRPAVGIDVFKSTQANVVDVADRVIAAVEEARTAPQVQGIQILVVGNQAESIRDSLRELRNAGLVGAVLSFFMLLLFLRHLPTTLIVSLAVPASLLVTLGAMYFLGFTLNILTMMGMLLADRHAGGQRGGDHRKRVPAPAAHARGRGLG